MTVTVLDTLTEDMKVSMKAGEAERTGTLRLLRGALKNEEIKQRQMLDNEQMLKVLQREAKQRRDSIEAYRSAGRADLVTKETAELIIIEGYLPQTLNDDELGVVVDDVIAQMHATTVAQMGMVIGAVMKRVGAQADGTAVSRVVRARLST